MTRQRATLIIRAGVILSSALLLPFASCVTNAAETVGSGLTTVGSAGVHGAGQAADAVAGGFSYIARFLSGIVR